MTMTENFFTTKFDQSIVLKNIYKINFEVILDGKYLKLVQILCIISIYRVWPLIKVVSIILNGNWSRIAIWEYSSCKIYISTRRHPHIPIYICLANLLDPSQWLHVTLYTADRLQSKLKFRNYIDINSWHWHETNFHVDVRKF